MTSLLSFFFVIAPFWCLLACTGRAALDFDNGKITKTLGIPTVGALTTAAVYADHQNRGLQGSVEQTAFEVWKKITSLPNKMFLAEVDPTSGPFDKKTVIHIKGIGFSTALDELQKFLEAKSFQFKKPDSQHRDDIQNEIAPKDPYGEVLLSPSVTSPPQFFTRSIKSISDPAQNRTQPAVRFVSSLLEPQVYIHIRIIDGPYYVISARAISDTEVVGSFVPPSSAIGGNKVDAVPRTLSILSTTKPFQRTAQSHLSSLLAWVKQSRRSRSPAGVMGELRDFQRSAGSTFAWAFLSVEYFPYPLSKQQNAAVFRLYPVPVITEVLPRTLSLTGGEPLYLFGSNFFVSDKTQVKLYANTTKSDAEVRLRILDCELVMMRPPSVAINVTQTFTQKPERSEEVAAILCESPPWPVEEAVRIALSFNGQIYHDCIESEKSLGGYFKKTNDLRGYHDPMTLQYLDPQSLLGAAAKSVIERPKDIGLHKDAHNPHLISNVYNMSTLHARNESVAPKPILAFSVSKASNSDSNKQNILSDTLSPGTSAGTANLQKVSIVNQSAIENIVTHAEVSVKAVLGTEDGSTQAISSLDALQAPSREPADVKEIKLQQPATESQSVLASPRRLPRYSKKIADPLSIYLEDTQGNAYVLSRPFDTQQIRPDSRLLNDFMLMVCATAIGAIISETIRIPVFLGHLVGGLVIGPHYLNGVQQLVQISSIAQLGSAFLLFELGLHFSLSKIAKVARAAFFGGILAQVSFFVLFSQLAWLRQTSVTEGLIIGSFLSMSSTILCSRDIASRNAKEV